MGASLSPARRAVLYRIALAACRALGWARVGPARGGGKAQRAAGWEIRRASATPPAPLAGPTLRAEAIRAAIPRCRLVVWARHTPRRRLGLQRDSPRRGPNPKPDRLLVV